MNSAINLNPTWKGKTRLNTLKSPDQKTVVFSSVNDTSLPSTSVTSFSFLFGTGPNVDKSANLQMGFLPSDVSSSSTVIYTGSPTHAIQSQFPTLLRPFTYININVKQSDQKPLQRVFVEDSAYNSIYFQRKLTRTSFEVGAANNLRVKRLDVSITYPDGTQPAEYIELENDQRFYIGLGFQFIQLSEDTPLAIRNYHQKYAY
jgi:hypothetical protein